QRRSVGATIQRRAAPSWINPLGGQRPAQRRSVGASLIPEGANAGIVVGPARADLHPQFKEDLAAPEFFELHPRLGTDALEFFALVADHHALVAFALDDDGGRDAAQLPFFFEAVDDDGGGVWQLITGEAE